MNKRYVSVLLSDYFNKVIHCLAASFYCGFSKFFSKNFVISVTGQLPFLLEWVKAGTVSDLSQRVHEYQLSTLRVVGGCSLAEACALTHA
jgi:hypothetical protein